MASTLDITPIAGALGAEISGVNLADDLSNAQFDEIHRAFLDHHVIFFRDQAGLTPDAQKRFARRFGTLNVHPYVKGMDGHPELLEIIKEPEDKLNFGGGWHSDMSFLEEPALGSILYGVEIPAFGGDTLFANMYEAYDSLSEPIKELLVTLTAFHDGRKDLANYGVTLKPGQDYPRATHPVVPFHPETGRRVLFVNPSFTVRIEGLEAKESEALLNFLYELVPNQPRFHCRVRWQPGTVVFWDNRCVQHHAIWDYYPETRCGDRVTIQGTTLAG